MKLKSNPSMILSAAVIALFGFTADVAMAGKGGGGNGGGNGGGGGKGGGHSSASSSSKPTKSKQTRPVTSSQSSSKGKLASELKKANGAIHASDTAWANASANGVPGIARTYAEAQAGLEGLDGDLEQLNLDRATLEGMTSFEDYQAQIDALSLEDFPDGAGGFDQAAYDAELARLEGLRDDPATLTDADIAAGIETIDGQLAEYEGYEQAKADALAQLIGDRELSPEAMAELDARVQAYLASDAYQSTIEAEATGEVVVEEGAVQ